MRLAPTRLGAGLLVALGMLGLGMGLWLEREAVMGWVQGFGPVPAWVFFAAMSILPVGGFPIAIFYVYAGWAYGPALGIPLCVGALAINMSLSYGIAARWLRGPITAWLARKGHEVPNWGAEGQFRLVFLMRTVPGPPFPVQNYLLALAGIPFATYLVLSVATQGLIAAGMVFASSQIAGTDHGPLIAVIVGALVAVLLLGRVFAGWRARSLRGQ